MIDSQSFPAALRRSYHYWFTPAGYDTTYETSAGIIGYGINRVFTYVTGTPLTIASTGSQTITIYSDPGFKVGWIIQLYPGTIPFGLYMLARITSYTESLGVYTMTFECYQSEGSGDYSNWNVFAQWENASNYIQNPQYSAKELSSRANSPLTAEFTWPYGGTSNSVITSDTELYKAGYTDRTYNGYSRVYEDEYEYNRPYIDVTVTSSRDLITTTTTTTWNYSVYPPEETQTITTATSTLTNSHKYSEADFATTGSSYSPGAPAVYADGGIVSFPTPSLYSHEITIGSTYRYSSYEHTFQEFPVGVFRPAIFVDVTTELGSYKPAPISPPGFFYPG
jgi:hypothetical protein